MNSYIGYFKIDFNCCHIVLFTLIISIGICGCSPVYYRPNHVNTPLLGNASQGSLYVDGSTTAQIAFSPANHIGILAGGSYFSEGGSNTFGNEKVNFYEIGGGYYDHLYFHKDTSGSRKQSKWVYDCYAGFGHGNINVENNNGYSYPSMTVSRLFIQPGIGVRTKIIEFCFNLRITDVFYSNFNYPASSGTPNPHQGYFFAEPAVTFRIGYKPVKFEMQFVTASPFSKIQWNYEGGSITAGASIIIGGYRNWGKKQKELKGK